MISLDSSIVPAVLIFLVLTFALNHLLFQPLLRVQAERESKTSGLVAQARKDQDYYLDSLHRYQATIKNARVEGYRHQEQVRSQALQERAQALEVARKKAELLLRKSEVAIQTQMKAAKDQLGREAHEIALGIAARVLQRSA